jgi:hypothetical protein
MEAEHDFQDAFKISRSAGNGAYARKGRWWPVGPKLIFNEMAAPVPEIMGGSM